MLYCFFFFLSAFSTPPPGGWPDPVYEVEIIAFTRTVDPAMSGGEDASLSAHRPDLDSGFSLDMLGGLPIDNLKLGNVVARLKADQNYQVLLHQAWRQPVGTSATAPWLQLSAGSVTDGDGNSQPEFAGLIKLYRNPHLFMDADLLLRRLGMSKTTTTSQTQYAGSAEVSGAQATIEASAAPAPTLKEYPLVSSNRVMEGQITYFDGPMLGLLVQARPVK